MMIIPDYIKVPLSALFSIIIYFAEANEIIVCISGIASIIYVIYKILESHEKRKYYKNKKHLKDEQDTK